MNTDNNMSFWEKWYWANFVRGTNPVTTFFWGIVWGAWIPFVASLIFCLVTDPQWAAKESLLSWSPVAYVKYFAYFWESVFTGVFHYIYEYTKYAVEHAGTIVRWFRHLLWLDDPEAFQHVGD